MKQAIRLFASSLFAVLMLAGLTGSVVAQEKGKDAKPAPAAKAEKGKSVAKVLIDNDRVQVMERTYKPGDVNEEVLTSSYRVNRTLQGGTLERTYANGKKEKLELKA